MSCEICHTTLTDKELIPYYKDNIPSKDTIERDQTFGRVFVCEKHYCMCMPQLTPWKWIQYCDKCRENLVCKTCRRDHNDDDKYCLDCSIIENRKAW